MSQGDPTAEAGQQDPPPDDPACPSCGATLTGEFCSVCGERRLSREDLSVRHFVGTSVAAVTNLDGRVLRSFRLLAQRPGFLTAEWLRGRRRPYLLPIQLFLLANVVYFFAVPLTGYSGYDITLQLQIFSQPYSAALGLEELVAQRIDAVGMDSRQYEQMFNSTSGLYARSLVIALIPLLAVGLLAIFPRGPAARHVVFATHYYAFELLFIGSAFLFVFSRVWPALYGVFREMGVPADILGLAGEFSALPLTAAYFYFALRRAYDASPARAAASVAGLLFFHLAAMLTYRLLLFWVTFATV